jgi:hypothetical protein
MGFVKCPRWLPRPGSDGLDVPVPYVSKRTDMGLNSPYSASDVMQK